LVNRRPALRASVVFSLREKEAVRGANGLHYLLGLFAPAQYNRDCGRSGFRAGHGLGNSRGQLGNRVHTRSVSKGVLADAWVGCGVMKENYHQLSRLVVVLAAALMVVAALALLPAAARAQFTTVINVPPNIGNGISIGSDTQLNMTSGSIGSFFDAGNPDGSSINIEVNISGGTVGNVFDAWSGSIVNIVGGSVGSGFGANMGSTVNISGGTVGSGFTAESGSVVNILGGVLGNGFETLSGSVVRIQGNEFRIDGVPLSGLDTIGSTLAVDIPANTVFSGVLCKRADLCFPLRCFCA